MEKGPQSPELNWQDITVEEVHRMLAADNLVNARLAAAIRIDVLQQICEDTDDAILKNEGEISPEEWEVEKQHIQVEIDEFKKIIETIDSETRDE